MSASACLVNYNKKEIIGFYNLPVSTIGEIMMNAVASAMVVYYLNDNRGDNIGFINDYDDDLSLYHYFNGITHQVIDKMLCNNILCEKEPKQIWLDDETWFRNLIIHT